MIESQRPSLRQPRSTARYSHMPPGYQQYTNRTYRAPELTDIMGDGPISAMQQDKVMCNERTNQSLRHQAMRNAYMRDAPSGIQESLDQHARTDDGYKKTIGPWKLGQTLGKGASAEVKFCRHIATKQLAACKIVSKCSSKLVQAGSLAALDRMEMNIIEDSSGGTRVPVAIEREVAILKLIQHPNIMKLYDIWENRTDIYLILELVNDGDLFNYITKRGRLPEETAVGLFRQIMSAMTYCHSFKICHRDLKPENILVTEDGRIKIADFGMAALHQTDAHKLHTACGSPHYAAPELLKARPYLGNRADIWSMGVILFAMLTARLPFDEKNMIDLLAKTKRGEYVMPEFLSLEAKDLIRRMLEVNPERRITMYDMWRHPLIMKYSAFDKLNPVTGQPSEVSLVFHPRPLKREEINSSIVHQLRTLWHMFSERDIIDCLTDETPSAQQAFYWLLLEYLDRQLEDFKPDIPHSRSDYHHLGMSAWKRKISTCEFTSGRSISRFTVISQIAETEADTVASYDPYNMNQYTPETAVSGVEPSATKVTIRRAATGLRNDPSFATNGTRLRRNGGTMASLRSARSVRVGRRTLSMGSMHSGKGVHMTHRTFGYKRPVQFAHVRHKSATSRRSAHGLVVSNSRLPAQSPGNHAMQSTRGNCDPRDPRRRSPLKVPRPAIQVSQTKDSAMIDEAVRVFRSRISKDIDNAFNSSMIAEPSVPGLSSSTETIDPITPISFDSNADTLVQYSTGESWKDCPLPALPPGMKPLSLKHLSMEGRRIATAPVEFTRSGTNVEIHSADIIKVGMSGQKMRASSGLAQTLLQKQQQQQQMLAKKISKIDPSGLEFLAQAEKTIRMVNSPKRPLTGTGFRDRIKERKRDSNATVQSNHQFLSPVAKSGFDDPQPTTKKLRKISWFQRLSSYSYNNDMFKAGTRLSVSRKGGAGSDTSSANGVQEKKKRFGLLFWKSNKTPNIDSPDISAPPSQAMAPKAQDPVQESWIARMFKVKPATEYMCLTMSCRDARRNLAALFKEWKPHGVKDIVIDRDRNIVFARVSAKNEIKIKPVAFAAEVMTVIEHGSKTPLCIVRFTQERGSASGFHLAVSTIKEVYTRRGDIVTDRQKARMMIKTLNIQQDLNSRTSDYH